MTIRQAAKELSNKLHKNFDPTYFTVGSDEKDTLYIYEHVRGFAKQRTLKEFEGFKVIYKYIGRIVAS